MKLQSNTEVIERMLRMCKLVDPFWDRWQIHGMPMQEITAVRNTLHSVQDWTAGWTDVSRRWEKTAKEHRQRQQLADAETAYRTASLASNLAQWLDPERNGNKLYNYRECIRLAKLADVCSPIETRYMELTVDRRLCAGRVRIPKNPIGSIILVNPIDSNKEEMHTYEQDFLNSGYITLSFDGPGQGETFVMNQLRGTQNTWEQFINGVIALSARLWIDLPIYLFGTSLGATWALYGSSHAFVQKTAIVSPAVEFDRMHIPSYFLPRMGFSCSLDMEDMALPSVQTMTFRKPIYLFHGQQDLMVPSQEIYNLFDRFPEGRKLREYANEGHCCNLQLNEIRKEVCDWFAASGMDEVNRI
ncbi:alpha/beta hydrolase [Paenibacillus barcinonensis]|uniref:Alpha/beta hydrolase n=1 Tax=Paenibacillus barcinonensis TaxID=198119 RepID=A0A2V4W2W9_PAEBA|nr:alpha/beta hydrolase [Paenibacillus barcinonensis]PYE48830.1 hypothetical protein DFQ00_107123 [Paenibacillus barcinonensis]QKS57744.1 alpha/beta hydrolase [Paenibacillus barcinonensis]